MSGIKVIAHRGGGRPENSLAALEKAVGIDVGMVELDVRATSDGHAVLMHDDTVNRTTNGHGKVSGMTLEEIKSLRLRNREPVPTLADALLCAKGRCQVILDLKSQDSALPSGKVVKELGMWKDVVFSSRHGPWLLELKLRHPGARLAFSSADRKPDCVRIAKSLKAEAVLLSGRIATRKLMLRAHEEGLDAMVWVVNWPWGMRRFIDRGADGIITDRPELLVKVLGTIDE